MNCFIDRIILNYCVAVNLNDHIPEELCNILNRISNAEKQTNRPIMKILITKKEFDVFEEFLATIPPFFCTD